VVAVTIKDSHHKSSSLIERKIVTNRRPCVKVALVEGASNLFGAFYVNVLMMIY
jgi:hypothetical protein